MEKSMTIAVDVAKDFFEVAMADEKGRIVERARSFCDFSTTARLVRW